MITKLKYDPQKEVEMTRVVMALFSTEQYYHHEQVPLGRKKIDIVCVNRTAQSTIAIELKIKDWRKALWQAALNCQVAHKSFIAIAEKHSQAAISQKELLHNYGVGLIIVYHGFAKIIFDSNDSVKRIARNKKQEWYQCLLIQSEQTCNNS